MFMFSMLKRINNTLYTIHLNFSDFGDNQQVFNIFSVSFMLTITFIFVFMSLTFIFRFSKPDLLYVSKETSFVEHNFEIYNNGPSPLLNATISITVPELTEFVTINCAVSVYFFPT